MSQRRANSAKNIFFVNLILHSPLTSNVVKRDWLSSWRFKPFFFIKVWFWLALSLRSIWIKKVIRNWMGVVSSRLWGFDSSFTFTSYVFILWEFPFYWPLFIKNLRLYLILSNSWIINWFSLNFILIRADFSLWKWTFGFSFLFFIADKVICPSSWYVQFRLSFLQLIKICDSGCIGC